eukprot:11718292-Alexandrium_andersonii.AAC.1
MVRARYLRRCSSGYAEARKLRMAQMPKNNAGSSYFDASELAVQAIPRKGFWRARRAASSA